MAFCNFLPGRGLKVKPWYGSKRCVFFFPSEFGYGILLQGED